MFKYVVPATIAGFLIATTGASAATVTGTIKSIDMAKDTVTLDNGYTYSAPAKLKLSAFKPGEKVTITYTKSNDKMNASALTPSS